MVTSIRRAAVAAACLGVMAFAAAPAMAWTPAGNFVFSSSNIEMAPAIAGQPPVLCSVQLQASLAAGTSNSGTINQMQASGCYRLGGCTASVTNSYAPFGIPGNLPWSVSGVNSGGGSGAVTINDVRLVVQLQPPGCNAVLLIEGDLVGNFSAGAQSITWSPAASSLQVVGSTTAAIPIGTPWNVLGSSTIVQGGSTALQ